MAEQLARLYSLGVAVRDFVPAVLQACQEDASRRTRDVVCRPLIPFAQRHKSRPVSASTGPTRANDASGAQGGLQRCSLIWMPKEPEEEARSYQLQLTLRTRRAEPIGKQAVDGRRFYNLTSV